MSALAEQARDKAREKVERLTRAPKGDVDASGWREPLGEQGMAPGVQTGPRPVSRRQFRRGGKVHGEHGVMHAGRKPRASGGMTADEYLNRNVKEANEARVGPKHVGGMKKGGVAHKATGGNMTAMALPQAFTPVARAVGGRTHGATCKCAKCGGGSVGKADGGSVRRARAAGGPVSYGGSRPEGGRIARAKGGRAKKGTTVNIIIAPSSGGPKPLMPPPGGMPPGGPVGMHQGTPPPPPAMPPPGAPPPMGGAPPMMRKSGGRAYPIENGAGGGKGRLEKIRAYGL